MCFNFVKNMKVLFFIRIIFMLNDFVEFGENALIVIYCLHKINLVMKIKTFFELYIHEDKNISTPWVFAK